MALQLREKASRTIKKDGTVVTEADGAIEKFLRSKIQPACPDHAILGEEMGALRKKETSEYRWALDPIDGTVNYALGFPFWGVSVGLLKNDIPVMGVVCLPELKELYWAEERKGAHFNGKRCRVAKSTAPRDEEIVIVPSHINKFDYSFPYKVRCFGSAAAHLCYVARGLCVGALLEGWNEWDVAAGLCVLQEAGAEVTDLNGIPVISLGGRTGMPLLVSSPTYYQELLSGIRYRSESKA